MLNKKHKTLQYKNIPLYAIAIIAYYYMANRLISFEHWSHFTSNIKLEVTQIIWLLVFIALWSFNIGLETKKWQVLISPYVTIKFNQALRQFFAGTFTALGSPARIAEPGGRFLLMEKKYRLDAVLATTIGGIMQNLIIGVLGFIALWSGSFESANITFNNYAFYTLIIGVLLIIISVVILFRVLRNKLKEIQQALKKLSVKYLIKGIVLTLFRFIVFNMQLFAMFKLLTIEIPFIEFILLSPVYFLLITLIPSFILADIGIRGSVAMLIFNGVNSPEPLVLTAILIQWLFNVVVPAIIGSWVLHKKSELFR